MERNDSSTREEEEFDVVDVENDFTRRWFAPNDDEHRALLKLSHALVSGTSSRGGPGGSVAADGGAAALAIDGSGGGGGTYQQQHGHQQSPSAYSDNDVDGFDYVVGTTAGGGRLGADPHGSARFQPDQHYDDDHNNGGGHGRQPLEGEDSTQSTNSNYSGGGPSPTTAAGEHKQHQRRSTGGAGEEEDGGSGSWVVENPPRQDDADNEDDDDEEVDPDVETPFMICPITTEVMIDPVITSDGMTFERVAIEAWIKSNASRRKNQTDLPEGFACFSPLTNAPITDDLRPNLLLKDAIAKWRDIKKAYKKKVQELTQDEWDQKFKRFQYENQQEIEQVRQQLAHQQAQSTRRNQQEADRFENQKQKEEMLKKELAKDYVRHWQRDSTATSCIHCQTAFGNFRRKHHCRNCGYIFCHACCSSLAQIEGVTNKVARVRTPGGAAATGRPTSASTGGTMTPPSARGPGGGSAVGGGSDAPVPPPPLERVCVRCALMFANAPASSGGPGLVIVPPSFKNYFHLDHTQHWTAGVGDSLETWSEYVKTNAPVAGQWAKDTTLTMAEKLMHAWTVASSKVAGR